MGLLEASRLWVSAQSAGRVEVAGKSREHSSSKIGGKLKFLQEFLSDQSLIFSQ